MKRHTNLFQQICSLENLQLADALAQKGKAKQHGVIKHNRNRAENIERLQKELMNGEFRTSAYTTFTILEPKQREIFRLPYYPDRVVQHAIMNVLEPMFVACFTADAYSCIKGRGIHSALAKMNRTMRDEPATRYCLKLDIQKFYPSVDHEILKALLRRKFKDADLLQLLDEIIDSAPGLPIGNYLSQYLANFYLTYFDHWLKEVKDVRYYFRYADDIVVLSGSKNELHQLLADIKNYLSAELRLTVKDNYQVFPVAARGIDFLGYRFYHTHVLLRKRIKRNLCREAVGRKRAASLAALTGWASHCDSKHLLKTLNTL